MKYGSFYVYVLMDSTKPGPFFYGHWKFPNEPFYVGKGKNKRLLVHEKLAKRKTQEGTWSSLSDRSKRIRKILRVSKNPVPYRIVRYFSVEKDAFELEIKLIHKIGRTLKKVL